MPELIPAEPGTPEWLAARRQGVTATDIVTILGLSHYDSVYSLFWRKLGQVPDEPDRDRLALGRALEWYIAERWREANDPEPLENPGLFRHSARPWQLATVNALTHAREPVELKSWADADRHSWDTGPPAQVRAQVLWQMDVMDVAVGHVGVVFLPSGEFRSFTIEHCSCVKCRNEPDGCPSCSACSDVILMRAAGEEFMGRLRLELPPPDPDSSLATLAAVRARFARVPAKQAEVSWLAFDQWNLSKREVDRATEQMRKYEIELREQIGEASEITVDGQVVARRVVSDATVKEHVRHQDYLRRVQQQGDDSE